MRCRCCCRRLLSLHRLHVGLHLGDLGLGLVGRLLGSLLLGCNWWVFVYAVNTGRIVETSLGYYLTPLVGNKTMEIGASLFVTDIRLVIATVVGAPVVTVMASYLPTLSALSQDPAIVLMDN